MEMVVLLSKQKPVPHTTKCALRKGQLKVDQDDHIGEESVGACVGGGGGGHPQVFITIRRK